jgi:hypothetical protein
MKFFIFIKKINLNNIILFEKNNFNNFFLKFIVFSENNFAWICLIYKYITLKFQKKIIILKNEEIEFRYFKFIFFSFQFDIAKIEIYLNIIIYIE